jgi:pSer/pThr/pTyr-binding forkhead associated (FHA) protein
MEVRLIVQSGSRRKKSIPLRSAETIVGRRQDCDLRIPSAEVSRRHCLLSVHDGYLTVEDLDSVNGTFVNGVRVAGKQVVRPGDSLEIGPLAFRADYQLSPAALRRLRDQTGEQEEEVEVLPLSEEEPEALPVEEERSGSAFHFDDEPETELIPPDAAKADDDADVIPLAEAAEEEEWQSPGGDLRELFSDMEPPKKPPRPRKP